ncbi:putative beta-tubulin polyglutamylase [Cucumis melo var. makuwa]|uniref:Beta-tubulin polyglutamylase n=1 Tax=Cucumis melo var. makuwa TaxID=1194695 RepID=A0A5A7T1G0_CUCMM|nr:putative beta-tubulin polyglutamylase [Cucumis melo var. makuwa]
MAASKFLQCKRKFYLPFAIDFHTLSRREIQALGKRNKIPANITNVAMADALAARSSIHESSSFLYLLVLDCLFKFFFLSDFGLFALRIGRRNRGVFVEGIEEFPELPMKAELISSEIPRIALRTSERRKAFKDGASTTRSQRK